MTINFETLKASLVLYGLKAVYAAILLIVGWYLSGLVQRFVSRLLTVRIGSTRSSPWSGSQCCNCSGSRRQASSRFWARLAGDRPRAPGDALQPGRRRHVVAVPSVPHR
jgi:hypothetical protein